MIEPTAPTQTASLSTSLSTAVRRVGLIMTYNQRETCIEAINSLVTQTLALDLIIISDDCSTDGTYDFIADYLLNHHRGENIRLYRTEKNLGFIPHFNSIIKERCTDSDLIYYNAGDDISEKSRTEDFYNAYIKKGSPRYFLGHSYVTSFGSGKEEILVPPIESIKDNRELCLIASAYHIGASQVFTGALFFDFGPILFDDCYEDLTLGYRALLKNAYHFLPHALVRYRAGGLSSWQKNPLEKKRDRLMATLTQRAVDSMRSGDFQSLSTLQDCYSQYGFSHTPHKDKLEILVVGEQANERKMYDYSVADHFSAISNVCNTSRTSIDEFIDLLKSRSDKTVIQNQIAWIMVSRVKYSALLKLMSFVSQLKHTALVLDMGIMGLRQSDPPNMDTMEYLSEILHSCPRAMVHTSCLYFFEALSKYCHLSRITYLQPLQSIDGPESSAERRAKKKGGILVLSQGAKSAAALSSAMKAHANIYPELDKLEILYRDNGSGNYGLNDGVTTPGNTTALELSASLRSIDYLILLNEPHTTSPALAIYWWTLSARYGIPVFLNSDGFLFGDLNHGENCLIVDSDVNSWSVAMNIILRDFEALKSIASNARRYSYFNCSIQKQIRGIVDILGKSQGPRLFFNKFLAL
jgi:glycosyltransferase involved in cell wall biosynthesis